MPKGGLFHAHSSALGTYEYFRNNVLNLPNLYICEKNNQIRFLFTLAPENSDCEWKLLQKLRKKREDLDSKIENFLQLQDCDAHSEDCENINVIWKKFKNVFLSISGLIKNRLRKFVNIMIKIFFFNST